jgi:cephalosporin-C deacetylase
MMRTTIFLLGFCLGIAGLEAAGKYPGTPDKPSCVYKVGETASIAIHMDDDDGKPLANTEFTVQTVGDASIKDKKYQLKTDQEGNATLKLTLNQPGFIRCFIPKETPKGKDKPVAGIAFEPEKLQPALPKPEDFDAYWDKILAELHALPLDATVTPVDTGRTDVVAYEVSIATPDPQAPARGFLAHPADASPKSLPARLLTYGAGTFKVAPPLEVAARGCLVFAVNPHSLPSDKPKEFYDDIRKNELFRYQLKGLPDRDKLYMRNMAIRAYRALMFLKSRPEWNGNKLAVSGSSQGGWQALIMAGLDPSVGACVAFVPGRSDTAGTSIGRDGSWKRFFILGEHVANQENYMAYRYIDGVYFASRIKSATCLVSAAFHDATVAPSSIYCAYNAIPSPNKRMINDIDAGHATPKATRQKGEEFIEEYFAKRP